MKKTLLASIACVALISTYSAVAQSQLSRAWESTASVTSKQPVKSASGAKIDPAMVTVKAKDVDSSISKALDMVEERIKNNNDRIVRALETQTRQINATNRTLSTTVSAVEGKLAAVLEEGHKRIAKTTEQFHALPARLIDLETLAKKEFDDITKKSAQGTAVALAASGLVFDLTPERISFATAASYYEGQFALAIGLSYSDPIGYRVNASVSATQKNFGVTIGAGFLF